MIFVIKVLGVLLGVVVVLGFIAWFISGIDFSK